MSMTSSEMEDLRCFALSFAYCGHPVEEIWRLAHEAVLAGREYKKDLMKKNEERGM
jgi:hypothetical protein